MATEKKKLSLVAKTAIGFAIGIILGIIFKEKILAIDFIGTLFLNLMKMLVVPLVFFSIVSGALAIGDIRKMRNIAVKTLIYFVLTTILAGCIGVAIAYIFKPGVGFDLSLIAGGGEGYDYGVPPTLKQTILGLVPTNIFASLHSGDMVPIIVFALLLGVCIQLLGEKGEPLKKAMDLFANVMYKMTGIIMELSPIGVAALIACTVGQYGLKIFGPLVKFLVCDYLACLIVLLIVYALMLRFLAGVPIRHFYKKMVSIWLMTVSTCSSAGTLPLTVEVTTTKMGAEKDLSSFILPLGATMNMNGAVVFYSMVVCFVSNLYGIHMTLGQVAVVVLTATLLAIGSAGVPGSAIVMTTILLGTMNLPLEIMGLIAGTYRLFDMMHTSMNVTGDVVTTLCVAKSEKLLDVDTYKS